MILVALRPIKRTELAIDIADVGVIDVAIDNVSDDLISPAVVGQVLRPATPLIREDAEFFQRETIQLARVLGRNSFPGQNFFRQRVSVQRHHFPILAISARDARSVSPSAAFGKRSSRNKRSLASL